ncbi:mitochondrial enolase superfamily member 1 [Grus japonensis]|uniref:Mitochondrial enolase superfamily member 1 n=1 Tax=Grus japonensis TaxID=30415 RepID=A0ABC9WBM4_GRUJA
MLSADQQQGLSHQVGTFQQSFILDAISKHVEEKKVIRSHQHVFTKGNDGMTGWVDEGRAVDVVSLDFRKAFDTISHNILMGHCTGPRRYRSHQLLPVTLRVFTWHGSCREVMLSYKESCFPCLELAWSKHTPTGGYSGAAHTGMLRMNKPRYQKFCSPSERCKY